MSVGTVSSDDLRVGSDGPRPEASYRPDIDGLRAVSILLVVAFHAGIGLFGGGYVGVDVFFVISGFLITGLLLDEHARAGRISMIGFYARRMRRLLPLSALVLIATLILGWFLLPPLDRGALLGDARAAALYFANWRFAGQAGAYSDTGPTDSLLVHYWSLSIEEQFYLAWPLLLLVVGMVARRRPTLFRPALGATLALLGIGSLVASASLTPGGANSYYWTHVRIWELAAGAGLALARPLLRDVPKRAAAVAGFTGIGCIFAAAITFGQDTIFPGTAALLPVAGAILVLIAGFAPGGLVPRALAGGPLPGIGRISYGWYLWHWPAIGLAGLLARRDVEGETVGAAGWAIALAVMASLLLAMVSHRLVEQPVRRSRRLQRAPRLSVAFGVVLTLVPVGITLAGDDGSSPIAPAAIRGSAGGVPTEPVEIVMTPREARDDKVTGVGSCHHGFTGRWIHLPCVFGDPDGDTTIALVGDSHGLHWFPVFERVAQRQGWRLLLWTKSACPMVDLRIYNYRQFRPYEECSTWRDRLFDQLRSYPGKLDLVVIGRSRGYHGIVMDARGDRVDRGDIAPYWERGARRAFGELLEASHRVLLIEDTPWAPHDVPACLSENPRDPGACSFDAGRALDLDATLVGAERAAASPGVSFVDLSRELCPGEACPVISAAGLIMYRDAHHMTARYNRTLAPVVLRVVEPLLERSV